MYQRRIDLEKLLDLGTYTPALHTNQTLSDALARNQSRYGEVIRYRGLVICLTLLVSLSKHRFRLCTFNLKPTAHPNSESEEDISTALAKLQATRERAAGNKRARGSYTSVQLREIMLIIL